MHILLLAVTAVLILANAFFAVAEYALIRIRSTRLEELIRKGHRRAKVIHFAQHHLDGYLSAIQLGISMVSLGVGWLGEPALAYYMEKILPGLPIPIPHALWYSISFAVAFLGITAVHMLLGELIPKLVAIRAPESMGFLTILPLTAFYYVAYPMMWALNSTAHLFLRMIRLNPDKRGLSHSDDEIRILLDRSEEEGRMSLDRLMMFENLFDFGRGTVQQIMTLRANVAFLSLARPWEENRSVLLSRKFSRFPLCETDLDSVIGYILVKDLTGPNLAGGTSPDLRTIRRDIISIGENTLLEDALSLFQQRHRKVAAVTGSDGKFRGLVTTEDVIEEIVGEIRDEYEVPATTPLSQATVPQASLFDLSSRTRFEAVKTMLTRLHQATPVFDFNETLNAVYKREQGLSSAVGHQAAFPHARVSQLTKPLVAFARSGNGIDFRATDGQPVKLIFLILSPFNEPTAQLRILSQLAGLISNLTLQERLLETSSADELMEIITSFEEKIPL
jgi:CBS domain containing-hemolysin-like protein